MGGEDSAWGAGGVHARKSGLRQMIRRRGEQADPGDKMDPPLFRRAYAHLMLAPGMQEGDLMLLARWQS